MLWGKTSRPAPRVSTLVPFILSVYSSNCKGTATNVDPHAYAQLIPTRVMCLSSVSLEATAPSLLSKVISSEEPPLASMKSAWRECSGTEQRPSVAQTIITHST